MLSRPMESAVNNAMRRVGDLAARSAPNRARDVTHRPQALRARLVRWSPLHNASGCLGERSSGQKVVNSGNSFGRRTLPRSELHRRSRRAAQHGRQAPTVGNSRSSPWHDRRRCGGARCRR